jgi:phenylalanyl-tRNA synthetase beta chain
VDLDTPCQFLLDEIESASDLVSEVRVFDLYQGEHVPEGKRSLALSVLFRSGERTLKDEEADETFDRIIKTLVDRFGVVRR